MEIAERNRKIKSVLSAQFGKGKVRVRGSRGTAHGWVTVNIDHAPKNIEERRELEAKVWDLFKTNGIQIGTYGYDDPGSDYGHGSKIHINFEQCLDVFNEGERVYWNGHAGTIKDRDYAHGGDWYNVKWDDVPELQLMYKNDLSRTAE
jgi:hypothetical protein